MYSGGSVVKYSVEQTAFSGGPTIPLISNTVDLWCHNSEQTLVSAWLEFKGYIHICSIMILCWCGYVKDYEATQALDWSSTLMSHL